jgi:hypothetical protein
LRENYPAISTGSSVIGVPIYQHEFVKKSVCCPWLLGQFPTCEYSGCSSSCARSEAASKRNSIGAVKIYPITAPVHFSIGGSIKRFCDKVVLINGKCLFTLASDMDVASAPGES